MIERRKHTGRYKVANEIIGQEKRNTVLYKRGIEQITRKCPV